MDQASGIQEIDSTKLYLSLDTTGKAGKQGDPWKTRSPGIAFSRDCEFIFYLIPNFLKWRPIFLNSNSVLHVIFVFWKEMTGTDLRDVGKWKRFFNRIWIYLIRICCYPVNYVTSSLVTFLNIYWLMITMAIKTEKKSSPKNLSQSSSKAQELSKSVLSIQFLSLGKTWTCK